MGPKKRKKTMMNEEECPEEISEEKQRELGIFEDDEEDEDERDESWRDVG